jgi:hypothetical protein
VPTAQQGFTLHQGHTKLGKRFGAATPFREPAASSAPHIPFGGVSSIRYSPVPEALADHRERKRRVLRFGETRFAPDHGLQDSETRGLFDLAMRSASGTAVVFCNEFVPAVMNFMGQHRCVVFGAVPAIGSVLIATGDFDCPGALRQGRYSLMLIHSNRCQERVVPSLQYFTLSSQQCPAL